MGVSGAGKTTVGKLLALDLGWSFYEGDDLHPRSNVVKMAQGIPLTDEDRQPWLGRIRLLIDDLVSRGESGVIASSALKQAYRDQLVGDEDDVNRDSPDQTDFPGYSSLWVALNYNHESQERQMRPDSLKFPAFMGQPLYCQA